MCKQLSITLRWEAASLQQCPSMFTFKCIASVVAIHWEFKMFLEISGAASKYSQKTHLRKKQKGIFFQI